MSIPLLHPGRCLAAALFLATLTACAEDAPPNPAAADGEPVYGGTVVVAGANDLGALNSLVATEVYSQEVLQYLLFTPLVQMNAQLEFEPALARDWQWHGDTAVTFNLRRDVPWHDGRPTTAHDVAFTFERLKDPKTGFANPEHFEDWQSAEAVDSFTVRFRLAPHLDPLIGWATTPIMPQHLLAGIAPADLRNAPFNRQPVGNGPFRFVEYRANDRWIFEANQNYPKELGGRPYLDRIVWRVIPENSAQLNELAVGSADLVLAPRADQLRALNARPDVRAIVKPSTGYIFIGWNGRRPGLGDARVRRALALGINRENILNVLRGGYGQLGSAPIPPFHWAYADSLRPLPYAPDSARALLAQAGYFDTDGDSIVQDAAGRPLSIELKIPANNAFNRDIAEMVRSDLSRIGVRLLTRPVEFATLIDDVTNPARNFDAVLLSLQSALRLNLRDLFHSTSMEGPFQLASYRNPEVDRLLDQIADQRTRQQQLQPLHQLQRILRDEQPWTVLLYTPNLFALRERVRGVEMDIRGVFVSAPRWWIRGDTVAAQ